MALKRHLSLLQKRKIHNQVCPTLALHHKFGTGVSGIRQQNRLNQSLIFRWTKISNGSNGSKFPVDEFLRPLYMAYTIFSDDFGSDIGSMGIMSAKTLEKCPAWSGTDWLSWVGVNKWEIDQNLRIRCQDGKVLPHIAMLALISSCYWKFRRSRMI